MKLQHFSIIFIVIMIPIIMALSEYIRAHSETIRMQIKFDSALMNATHDAIVAFQLNTANNNYSTLQGSKMRDVSAALNTFYNNLAVSMEESGYTTEDLQLHTPAIVCTMYDGYYIYTKYKDQRYDPSLDGTGGIPADIIVGDDTEGNGEYKYGLKPLTTYACRYKKGTNFDFTINYTLDNTITVIGKVSGIYETRTGHLIEIPNAKYAELKGIVWDTATADLKTSIDDTTLNSKITEYICETADTSEKLRESLIIINDDGTYENTQHYVDDAGTTVFFPGSEEFEYVVYKSQKVYIDPTETYSNGTYSGREKFFHYSSEYKKDYVAWNSTDLADLYALKAQNHAALDYYNEAVKFTIWINEKLGSTITQANAVDMNGDAIVFASTGTNTKYLFNTKSTNKNNPLNSNSYFNEHRMNVLRYSIETNLRSVMKNYNDGSPVSDIYQYYLPKIDDDDWYKITNNISFVAFLQGIALKSSMYSNYCVVTNNTNKETVGVDSIYIVDKNGEYHRPGCKRLISECTTDENFIALAGSKANGYAAVDFERKGIFITGDDSNAASQLSGINNNKAYFYPQQYTACYECIVNAADVYSTDEIIESGSNASGTVTIKDDQEEVGKTITIPRVIYNTYLRALARERYNLYTINGYFGVTK